MLFKPRTAFLFFALLVLFILIGCSKGGGGKAKVDSCSNIGLSTRSFNGQNLRIVNGDSCKNAGSGPVTRVVLNSGIFRQGYCTGSFISQDTVLTAAHCFLENPTSVFILVGDTVESATRYEAESWDIHPRFSSGIGTLVRDVAVIHLKEKANVPVLPILMSSSPRQGDSASIYGYGTDEKGKFDFEVLKGGEMKIASVTASNIRADFSGSGSNTCIGDSGGPMVFVTRGRSSIIGITSTGTKKDCSAGDQSYFTNLQDKDVLDFLHQHVPDAEFF